MLIWYSENSIFCSCLFSAKDVKPTGFDRPVIDWTALYKDKDKNAAMKWEGKLSFWN